MSRRTTRGGAAAIGIALSSLLILSAGPAVQTAAAQPVTPAKPVATRIDPTTIRAGAKIAPALKNLKNGSQAVFVQLTGTGAADTAQTARTAGRSAGTAKADSRTRTAQIRRTATAVGGTAKSADRASQVLYSTTNTIPGVAIRVTDQAALDAIAQRPDVVKISAITPKTFTNASAAQLTKALNTWQSTGVTGKGVKVGIIDTGIDYTHADFGGAGTVAAYEAAHAKETQAFTPTAKVVGGYDFVGDSYQADPDTANYQPVPHPDSNPLDCNGHGSHVAGTAAGYGVNADGSTFTGSYSSLTGTKLYDMKIGPGMAPQASLYALRVFGCEGSTDVVAQALDWSLDPNGDGDFSDHLDIINLSLGSAYGVADDPENEIVQNLADHGVLPVMSAGNSGDVTDSGGSPGNAAAALTAASSVDEYDLLDGIKVTAPTTVAGTYPVQFSVAYPWATKPDVSGSVTPLTQSTNLDGCSVLNAADAAAVAGKVAWLEWDDNDATRRCGSAVRSNNVAAAGAIGAIFTSTREHFSAGITGSAAIPVVQLTKSGTDTLRPSAVAKTLAVTFSGSLALSAKQKDPSIVDTLSDFSSRGTHGAPGVVKPDVAAPGQSIISAGVGLGSGAANLSGTSMASPGTAGIAALVKATHPTWSPAEIKAAVMNTANHDVYTGPNKTGSKYGPNRVGSGRVDAQYATSTSVLAYNKTTPDVVSVSFGVVEAPASQGVVTRKQVVTVKNTAAATTTVSLAYQAGIKQPGVSYAVSPSAVSIKGRSSKDVTVTMTITTASLRRTIDPTMATTQTNPLTGEDEARQYVSDASGRLLVTPQGKASLRVPVYGAAKPVSKTKAYPTTLTGGQKALQLVGAGFEQGTGTAQYQSKVSVLDLGYTSKKLPVCSGDQTAGCVVNATTRSGDLRYVGAASIPADTAADTALWFGISTWGNWATIGHSTFPEVDIDTNGDGEIDFIVQVSFLTDTDLLWAVLYQADGTAISGYPVNYLDGATDTNVFDTNTLLIPVDPGSLGMTDGAASFPISYSVGTPSYFGSSDTDGYIDQTPFIRFDVANPAVQTESPVWADGNDTTIPYLIGTKAAASTASVQQAAVTVDPRTKKRTVRALLIHLQGQTGHRAEVVTLKG